MGGLGILCDSLVLGFDSLQTLVVCLAALTGVWLLAVLDGSFCLRFFGSVRISFLLSADGWPKMAIFWSSAPTFSVLWALGPEGVVIFGL